MVYFAHQRKNHDTALTIVSISQFLENWNHKFFRKNCFPSYEYLVKK